MGGPPAPLAPACVLQSVGMGSARGCAQTCVLPVLSRVGGTVSIR